MPRTNIRPTKELRKALEDAGLPILWSTYLVSLGDQLTNPLSSKPAPKGFWASPKGKTKNIWDGKKQQMTPKVFPVTEGDVLERLVFDLTDVSVKAMGKMTIAERVKKVSQIIFSLAAVCQWDHPEMVSLDEKSFYAFFIERAVPRRISSPATYYEDAVLPLLPPTAKTKKALA